MRAAAILAGLALAACSSAPPQFDIAALKPGDDMVTLTGWYLPAGAFREFRLYPTGSGRGMGKGECVSGAGLSLAGVPQPDFANRRMTITGTLHPADSPEVGEVKDTCGSGLILLAIEIDYAQDAP